MIMKERIFIQNAREHINLEEFVRKQFSYAKCGNIEVQHTPIMTRIIIRTTTPGLVIGSGGEKIRETLEKLKKEFNMENPQIDVQRIENPDMEPYIVAQSIARSIENGINYKRLGNYYLTRIMNAGAIGCEIVFSGKFSGQRARKERFSAGYLRKCGEPAERDVISGFAVASPKLGSVGITVKIMINQPRVILKEELKEKVSEEKEEEIKEETNALVEEKMESKEIKDEWKKEIDVEKDALTLIEKAEPKKKQKGRKSKKGLEGEEKEEVKEIRPEKKVKKSLLPQ